MLELLAASGFYLEGALSGIRAKDRTEMATIVNEYHLDALRFPVMDSFYQDRVSFQTFDRPKANNPYGDLAIGYDFEYTKTVVGFRLWHRSAIMAGDRGEEGLTLSVRYYPWK